MCGDISGRSCSGAKSAEEFRSCAASSMGLAAPNRWPGYYAGSAGSDGDRQAGC